MRSLGAFAVMLGVVALLSVVLMLASSGAETETEGEGWSSRALLALGPIRPEKKGLHRHGRVEYRYQLAECTETTGPTVTSTGTTTGTTVTSTSTTTAPTTTSTTTTTTTSTTTQTTTTTRPPCPITCEPTTDLCFPIVCITNDQLSACVVLPVVCQDNNNCTVDMCVNGTCVYTTNSSLPGCAVIAGGGLSGGQIAGIVVGAAAAAAIAALIAFWARRSPAAAPGAVNPTNAPLATNSPLYQDGGTAGVMPAL